MTMKSFNKEFSTLLTEVEGMVERRIENTGETREEAVENVTNYLRKRFAHLSPN